MAFYSNKFLQMLYLEKVQINEVWLRQVEKIVTHQFRTLQGKELAKFGLGRRIGTLRICILEIFQQLPPESSRAPDRDEAAIADALLNAFFVNVYGVLDNIANIWVCEKSLRGRNGKEIPRTRIGLGKRFEEVFCQLSTDMRKLVLHHEHRLAYIEEFRHATAHRIPPYVPPFSLDPDKMDEWHKLNSELLSAKAFEKADVCEALEKKIAHLKDFFPIIAHTSDPVNFRQLHPQIISDFLAAAEFTDQLIIDLKAP